MAKMQQECGHCAKKFFTTKIIVYVMKSRKCLECNIPMFCHENKYYECPKCGNKIDLKDEVAIASLPLEMKGTTRKFEERDKAISKGLEIEKIIVPEKRVCQRCENTTRHIRNIMEKQKNIPSSVKAKIRKLSDEDYLDYFYKHLQAKLRQENQSKPQPKTSLPPIKRPRGKLPDVDKTIGVGDN